MKFLLGSPILGGYVSFLEGTLPETMVEILKETNWATKKTLLLLSITLVG